MIQDSGLPIATASSHPSSSPDHHAIRELAPIHGINLGFQNFIGLLLVGNFSLQLEATVRTADELKELWASPRGKDILRRRNKQVEVLPSYPENTEVLDQYLQNDDDEDDTVVPEIVKKSLKRKREPEVFDEIIVEKEPRS